MPGRRPMVVGLTGGIGSGKSAVASLFAGQGIDVIDTDAISRALTAAKGAAMPLIEKTFGVAFVNADGALNRASMRNLVFTDPQAKTTLEAILHPLIRDEVSRRIKHAPSPYVILDVPLLFEAKAYPALMDTTLVVDCPEPQQISRAMARSGLTEAEVRAIMATQLPRQARIAQADQVIDNSGTLTELAEKVHWLHQAYLLQAKALQN
jgi:dephospho-CoA kinase